MNDNTDIIIVGAGTAGCVLAARLSEDPSLQIALVEAGGPDANPMIHVPAGLLKLLGNPKYDWCLKSGPEPHVNNRMIAVPRGRVLGGSGSINGMLYVRGSSRDYDGWAEAGCSGWGWADVLPYFRKSEDQSRGPSSYHGVGGPLTVSDMAQDGLSDAFIRSCIDSGATRTQDFNTGSSEGAGYYQINTRHGRRAGAAQVFLKPALGRPNLRVITDAYVTSLEFDRGKCTGVRFIREGKSERLHARAEVIVSGGSYLSPAILQRSGIGPAALLREQGIDVLVDRPNVGENLQDHFHTRVAFKTTVNTINNIAHSPVRQFIEGIRYKLTKGGFLANGVFRAGLFMSSPLSRRGPDLQILFGLFSYSGGGVDELVPHRFPGCSIHVVHLHPQSRGHVRISSSDPLLAPRIVSNFLASEYDRKVLISALRMARDIAGRKALAAFLLEEIQPGLERVSDEALLEYTKTSAYTVHHPVGTCRMGSDADAVVDPKLRVNGVDGLRVVDASVMPTIVSGNTNAPTIMIAEKATDLIKADLKRRT
jgi:choline dehydrogenase